MWNFVSDIEGGVEIEGFWEQGAEMNILEREVMKWEEDGESCMTRSFITYNHHYV
jgi:hypothetical protein